MKRATLAEATIRILTTMYGVVPESIRAGQIAGEQEVAQYGRELWWDS